MYNHDAHSVGPGTITVSAGTFEINPLQFYFTCRVISAVLVRFRVVVFFD